MPVILQTLNVNNWRTAGGNSTCIPLESLLNILLEKVLMKAIFTPTVFETFMSKGRSVLSPAQQDTVSERFKQNSR